MRHKIRTIRGLAASLCTLAIILTATAGFADRDHFTLPNGATLDLSGQCPVCGMIVGGNLKSTTTYGYKDGHIVGFAGVAAAVFKDGTVKGFEGARCLFIYNTVPKRFGIDVNDIAHRYVSVFDTRKTIDVENSYFVLGSDINGPMGKDLIPFSALKVAEDFKSNHGGKRIVQMGKVELKDIDRKKPLRIQK
jgi:copper chaperone NosL